MGLNPITSCMVWRLDSQSRAAAAGFRDVTAETVAINPAPAISGVELINRWYRNTGNLAVMSNCASSQMDA